MTFFQRGELKLLGLFYLAELLSCVLFFAPIFFLPYYLGLGFSLFQYGIIISTFLITSILFEIPTGVVADLHSRKLSVLIGWLIEGTACLLLFFLHNFYAILVTFAFFGVGSSFWSGAGEAWVVDLIKKRNKKLLNVYFFRERMFGHLGLVLSGILGAFIVKQYGLPIIWPLAALSFFLSFFILLFAEEYFIKRKRSNSNLRTAFKQTETSFTYSKNHKVLFYLFLAGIFVVFAGNFFSLISVVPLLKSYGLQDYALGYVFSFMGFLGIVSGFVGKKLHIEGNERKFIYFCLIICSSLSFMIFGVAGLISALIIVFGLEFFSQLLIPIQRIYFHKQIPSKLRATVGSVEGMILSLAGAIALPLAGLVVDNYGSKSSFVISGILLIPAIIFYLKIKE